MSKLFDKANRYLEICDWKDMALLKFCLFSMGIIVGTHVSRENKKATNILAALVFSITYVPLMGKFIPILFEKDNQPRTLGAVQYLHIFEQSL